MINNHKYDNNWKKNNYKDYNHKLIIYKGYNFIKSVIEIFWSANFVLKSVSEAYLEPSPTSTIEYQLYSRESSIAPLQMFRLNSKYVSESIFTKFVDYNFTEISVVFGFYYK